MTSSMMDGNLPEMIIIPLEEKDLKKMLKDNQELGNQIFKTFR